MASQVKQVLVQNIEGGLGASSSAEISVIVEGSSLHSYLIHKTSRTREPGRKSYDSVFHKFIGDLSPALLDNLLSGIAIIKPTITPSTFNLTPHQLIDELKKPAKQAVAETVDFEKLITKSVVNKAIVKTVSDIDRMDDFEYCEVNIITIANDTIKLSTRNLCPTKQPWTINNHTTYDMSINNFVVAAISREDVPNKESLNINSLKESIYNEIDEFNPGTPIATFKWKYYYPGNLKLLNEHFVIKEKFLYGNVYSCLLKTNAMPTNASLESRLNMASKEEIDMVIRYAAMIDKYFQGGNFVFKYYSNRSDTHIGFSYYTGRKSYNSLQFLRKKLPGLAETDSAKVVSFWISAPDDSSSWIIFPDNKVLLVYHSVTTPIGKTAPIYPKQDTNASWQTTSYTYYLFDNTGKVLSQGNGL